MRCTDKSIFFPKLYWPESSRSWFLSISPVNDHSSLIFERTNLWCWKAWKCNTTDPWWLMITFRVCGIFVVVIILFLEILFTQLIYATNIYLSIQEPLSVANNNKWKHYFCSSNYCSVYVFLLPRTNDYYSQITTVYFFLFLAVSGKENGA